MEKSNRDKNVDILKDFLGLPHSAYAVHERFSRLPGAVSGMDSEGFGYVYIPSKRSTPVLMVAHADVVGDEEHIPELLENDDIITNPGHILGADDRAGCAIIWALRHLGHGILITDGEEIGCLGAESIMENLPELREELQNRYQFMVEFDRKNRDEYKCYNVGTEAFRSHVETATGFHEPDRRSRTDIVVLAQDICGVNLSCGYMLPHTDREYIVKADWLNTLHIAEKWLSAPDLPKFERPL